MNTRAQIEDRLARMTAEIQSLPTAEKLRLAADLLDADQDDLAYQVVHRVMVERTTAIGALVGVRVGPDLRPRRSRRAPARKR